MKKLNDIFKKYNYIVENDQDLAASMGNETQADANKGAQPSQTPPAQPGAEAQNNESDQTVGILAPIAEVLLIRDILRALVIELPSDADIINLVSKPVPDKITQKETIAIHEQVNALIEQYKTDGDNEERLEKADKIIINENNRREVYKRLLQVIEQYS